MPTLQLVNGSYITTQRRNIAPGRIGFVTAHQTVSATVELNAANFDAVNYGAAGCVLHPGFGFRVESPLGGYISAQRDQAGTTVVTIAQVEPDGSLVLSQDLFDIADMEWLRDNALVSEPEG